MALFIWLVPHGKTGVGSGEEKWVGAYRIIAFAFVLAFPSNRMVVFLTIGK